MTNLEVEKILKEKYKFEHSYISFENIEKVYNAIIEKFEGMPNLKNFLEIGAIKQYDSESKSVIGIKFKLPDNKNLWIIPLEESLKEVLYINESKPEKIGKEIKIDTLEYAMNKLENYIKVLDVYGYFYTFNVKTYDYKYALNRFYKYKLYNNRIDLTEARYKLDKIKVDKIDDNIMLSNIYYLRALISKEYQSTQRYNKFYKLATERNLQNINIIKDVIKTKSIFKDLKNNMKNKNLSSKDITKKLKILEVAINYLDYNYFEIIMEELLSYDMLETIRDEIENINKFKRNLIEIYNKVLEMIKEYEIDYKYYNRLTIIKNILEIDFIDVNKYKSIADTLYYDRKYEKAIEYYKEVIGGIKKYYGNFSYYDAIKNEYKLNKDFTTNMNGEVYEKLIISYIKSKQYKEAKEYYDMMNNEGFRRKIKI